MITNVFTMILNNMKIDVNFVPIDQDFKSFEIEGCTIDEDGYVDIVDEEDAEFFSVYVRLLDDEARCIADLPNKECAEHFINLCKSLIKYGKDIS